MPHGLCWRLGFPGIGHAAVRHNQSPSRNARSWSSGRKRPDGVGASGDASERLLLHPHVGVDVDLGGLDVLVTKPERDHRWIDAVVEQVHRRAVAKRMRRDPLGADARARARCRQAVLADQMLKSIAAQPFAPDRREQRPALVLVVADPRRQQFGRLAAKRRGALLPALAHAADVRAAPEHNIAAP